LEKTRVTILFGVSANPLSLQLCKDKFVSATTGICQFNNQYYGFELMPFSVSQYGYVKSFDAKRIDISSS